MYSRFSMGVTRGLLPIVGNRLRNSAPTKFTVGTQVDVKSKIKMSTSAPTYLDWRLFQPKCNEYKI